MPQPIAFDVETLEGLQQLIRQCPEEGADMAEWALRVFDSAAEIRQWMLTRPGQLTTVWSRYDPLVPTGQMHGMPITLAQLLLLTLRLAALMQIDIGGALERHATYLLARRNADPEDPNTMPQDRFIETMRGLRNGGDPE